MPNMGFSPLRHFLAANQKLTTYCRFHHWNTRAIASAPSTTTTNATSISCHSFAASAFPRTNSSSFVDEARHCSTSAKERHLSNLNEDADVVDDANQRAARPSLQPNEDRTLPIIISDMAKDKRLLQSYTDSSEAAETAAMDRLRQTEIKNTIAFEIFEQIQDAQALVQRLNERKRQTQIREVEEQQRSSSSSERTVENDQDSAISSPPKQSQTPSSYLPSSSSSSSSSSPASRLYSRQQLSEEVTIFVGRDAAKMTRLDVTMQEVVDVIHELDLRTERQVPDVDNMRVPKSTSPMMMLMKMWIPQRSQFAVDSISELTSAYLRLSKSRLTMFVTLSAVGGFFIAPFDFNATVLLSTIVGTTLCSGAANAINQLMEIPFDSQMARTRDRPLVRAQLSSLHALTFALVSASTGTAILYSGANGIVAGLGLANLLLYTCVYTPMKRFTIVNTWAGAVVGAIPPLMGWAAATGSLSAGSLLFAGILYSWQFPHFNALSWNMRADYSRAGYCMMSVTNPGLCKRVALRHCLFLHAICFLAPMLDVTSWFFACDSFLLNAAFTFYAWKFYRDGDAKSSRNLFRFSLIYLPAILTFLLISKKYEDKNTGKKKTENFHSISSLLGL